MTWPHTFRSLRHRNYRVYFAGQLVSLIGSWMQTTALVWLAYDWTHSSTWPALVTAAGIGPTVLLGTLTGPLAERFGPLRVLRTTQSAFLVSATLMAVCVGLGLDDVRLLWLLALLHGLIQAVDFPARLTLVPDLVPRDDLVNAVSLNSVLFNVARAIGPALAVLLIDRVGAFACFMANAASYLAVLLALTLVRDLPPRHPIPDGTPRFRIRDLDPRLLRLILFAGLASLGGWPLMSLLPALADRNGGGPGGYGTLLSCVGAGALLGALATATVGTEARQRPLMLVGAMMVSAGLALVGGFAEAAWGGCALFGAGMIVFLSTDQAAVQLAAPPGRRGPVVGLWASAVAAGAPLGNLIAGPLADAVGAPTVILAQAGLLALVAGGVFAKR